MASHLSIKEICIALNVQGHNTTDDTQITRIVTNSANATKGCLFFALAKNEAQNKLHAQEALEKGAHVIADTDVKGGIYVPSSPYALLSLAKYYKQTRLKNLIHTVAITGSNGKTTTKEILTRLLRPSFKTHSTEGNQNNTLGVSYTILSAPLSTEVLVIEAGMNHSGELRLLSEAIAPSICIITNVGTAHIGNLGSRKAIADAKLEITECLSPVGHTIIPYGESLLSSAKSPITVSLSEANADVRLLIKACACQKTTFDLCADGDEYTGLEASLTEEHQMKNLSLALAASLLLQMDEKHLRAALLCLSEDLQRHKFITLNSFTILDDSYNASLESVASSLKILNSSKGVKSILLGDVKELGEYDEQIHRKIGKIIAEFNPKNLYLIGVSVRYVMMEAIRCGFPSERICYNPDANNPQATAVHILNNHVRGETILFKASRAMKLERVIDILKSKEIR